jgi:hypothetical protein
MGNSEFIKCKTQYMGKYLEFGTEDDLKTELFYVKSLCSAFMLYFKLDFYDSNCHYLRIAISYPSELFMSSDYETVIKIFMLEQGYLHLESKIEMKHVTDDPDDIARELNPCK